MSTIYVLELEDGKYYVGRTNDLERRIREHQEGRGSAWTNKHKFVSLKKSFESENAFCEDMIVKCMMHTHGIANVRGGSYSQIRLPKSQYMLLLREIRGATNKCFNCGGDHFVSDCDKNKDFDCDNDKELSAFIKESIDVGYRVYASGIRKTRRMLAYFW